MTVTEYEEYDPSPTNRLNDSLIAFTGCIGEALEDICSYGWTVGDSYVPFDPDPDDECDDEEAVCAQAWVRVMNVTPTGEVDSWGGDCGGTLSIDLEVGVLRCIEVMEDGAAPTASQVLVAAAQSMADMKAIYCAAMGCEEAQWAAINAGQWVPTGPLGGQYGGLWTFSVEL